MNKEAITKELNGHVSNLLEFYQRKEKLIETVKKAEIEIAELVSTIKNTDGIIQTLQFMLKSDGFTNLEDTQQRRQPVELSSNTNINELNAALKGNRDGKD